MEHKTAVNTLAALAQESRLAIFRLLVTAGPQGLAVGRIGEQLHIAPATLSFHLKELARADLICPRQESRFIYYSANFSAINGLLGYLSDNCCEGARCELQADVLCSGSTNSGNTIPSPEASPACPAVIT